MYILIQNCSPLISVRLNGFVKSKSSCVVFLIYIIYTVAKASIHPPLPQQKYLSTHPSLSKSIYPPTPPFQLIVATLVPPESEMRLRKTPTNLSNLQKHKRAKISHNDVWGRGKVLVRGGGVITRFQKTQAFVKFESFSNFLWKVCSKTFHPPNMDREIIFFLRKKLHTSVSVS